jgi:anti-sigma factor RsiW
MGATMFDDETLMAFADGELDDATMAEVAAAIDRDPALAERVAVFSDTRRLSRDAFAPLLEKPVPAALSDAVKASIARSRATTASQSSAVAPVAAPVIDLSSRRAAQAAASRAQKPTERPRPANQNRFDFGRMSAPIAASIAVVAAGLIGYMAGTGFGPTQQSAPAAQVAQVALIDLPGLDQALDTVASGNDAVLEGSDLPFRAIASFRDGGDRLCREFEVDAASGGYVAVACEADEAWSIALAINVPSETGGYTPASSLDTLDAYLTSIDAGSPLSPEDEAAALSGR